MSDFTQTPNLGLYKPNYDMDAEQWGYHLNDNADILDGVFSPTAGVFLPLAGGMMNGAIEQPLSPVGPFDLVNKLYIDSTLSGSYLRLSGGTLTGALTLAGDPTTAFGAVSKQYADALITNAGGPFLPMSGGNMATTATLTVAQGVASTANAQFGVGAGGISYMSMGSIGANIALAVSLGTPYFFQNGIALSAVATQAWANGAFLSLGGGTVTGATTLSAGGTLTGAFAGSPTWSGSHIFGAGSGGAGTGLTVNNAAIVRNLGNAGGTFTYTTATTPGVASSVFYGAINVAGALGNNGFVSPYTFNVGANNVDNSANAVPWMGSLFSNNFGGTRGSVGGMMISQNQTSATADTGSGAAFYNTLQIQNSMAYAAGSSGSNAICLNALTNFAAGATNWGRIEAVELAVQRVAGSTVAQEIIVNVIRNAATHATQFETFFALQCGPGSATSSNAGFLLGLPGGQWPIDNTNGWVMSTMPQIAANPGNAQKMPQAAAGGIDLSRVNFSGNAWQSPGVQIGSASLMVGSGVLSQGAAGPQIDSTGYVGAIASVATAGSGYQVNDQLYDGLGGIILVTAVTAGNVTAASYIAGKAPYSVGAGPATVATTGGSGNGVAAFNVTWTARTTLALNPSGGAVTHGGPVTVSGTLGVTGATTHSGNVTVAAAGTTTFNGPVNMANSQTMLIQNGAALQSQATAVVTFNSPVTFGGTATFGGAGNCTITSGSAVPASTQPAGSIYMHTGGASGARLYVSAGAGAWSAVAGV